MRTRVNYDNDVSTLFPNLVRWTYRGGWVFAAVNGVVCVDVKGSAVLSNGWDKPRCAPRTGSFLAKIEMTMPLGVAGM